MLVRSIKKKKRKRSQAGWLKAAFICYDVSDGFQPYNSQLETSFFFEEGTIEDVLMNIRQTMEIKTINSQIKTITINLNGLFICNSKMCDACF